MSISGNHKEGRNQFAFQQERHVQKKYKGTDGCKGQSYRGVKCKMKSFFHSQIIGIICGRFTVELETGIY